MLTQFQINYLETTYTAVLEDIQKCIADLPTIITLLTMYIENQSLNEIQQSLSADNKRNIRLTSSIEAIHALLANPNVSGLLPSDWKLNDDQFKSVSELIKTKLDVTIKILRQIMLDEQKKDEEVESLKAKIIELERAKAANRRPVVIPSLRSAVQNSQSDLRPPQSTDQRSQLELRPPQSTVQSSQSDLRPPQSADQSRQIISAHDVTSDLSRDTNPASVVSRDAKPAAQLTLFQINQLTTDSSSNEAVSLIIEQPSLLKQLDKGQQLAIARKHFKIANLLALDAVSNSGENSFSIAELSTLILETHRDLFLSSNRDEIKEINLALLESHLKHNFLRPFQLREIIDSVDANTLLDLFKTNQVLFNYILGCLDDKRKLELIKFVNDIPGEPVKTSLIQTVFNSINFEKLTGETATDYFELSSPEKKQSLLLSTQPHVIVIMAKIALSRRLTAALSLGVITQVLQVTYPSHHDVDELIRFLETQTTSFLDAKVAPLSETQNRQVMALILASCDRPSQRLRDLVCRSELFAEILLDHPNWEQMVPNASTCLEDLCTKYQKINAKVQSNPRLLAILRQAPRVMELPNAKPSSLFNKEIGYTVKVQIIGDSGVGKSCLLLRYADDSYTESYISTIGVDFKSKSISYRDAKVELKLFDSQANSGVINSDFYKGTNIYLVVYDITDQVSFNNAKQWMQGIERYANNPIVIMVGNKCDLKAKKVVDYKAAKEFADSLGVTFIETSAKDSINVEPLFLTAVDEFFKKRILNSGPPLSAKFKLPFIAPSIREGQAYSLDAQRLCEVICSFESFNVLNAAFKVFYNNYINEKPFCSDELKTIWKSIQDFAIKLIEREKDTFPDKSIKRNYLCAAYKEEWLVHVINPGVVSNFFKNVLQTTTFRSDEAAVKIEHWLHELGMENLPEVAGNLKRK